MPLQPTHYITLSLSPTASSSSIRAAYKSLAQTSHPDKTTHLPASARAAHAALFRRVQEAYDVLSNPALKESYDKELARHGGGGGNGMRVRGRGRSGRTLASGQKARGENPVRVKGTMSEGKGKGKTHASLRARVDRDIKEVHEMRARRDAEDEGLDLAGLRGLLAIWTDMVGEFEDDASGEGELRAWCAVQMQVYLHRVEEREEERKAGKAAQAEMEAVEDATLEKSEKERKDAVKQARVDAKAAAVRKEKEAQKARVEERDRREAQRVARVRSKAGVPVLCRGRRRDSAMEGRDGAGASVAGSSPSRKKCGKCGAEHKGFVEWKKCAREKGAVGEEDEESFFRTV